VTATRRVSSDAPWEQAVGYSRAVAAGDFIFVTGSTSVRHGEVVHEGDAREQTIQAIANIGAALERLGAGLPDVVRTRMFVTDISRWPEIGDAHRAAFGDVLPPPLLYAPDERPWVAVAKPVWRALPPRLRDGLRRLTGA